jgi:RNA polymerase sigma-70 factor (ECF subfamily)
VGVCDETTEELVLILQRGADAETYFRCLYERYYTQLKRFFLRKGLSNEDAQELTHDTFFSVYKNLEGLRESGQFEAWMFRIALNAFRNRLEKTKAQKRTASIVELKAEENENPLEEIAGDAPSPLEEIIDEEQRSQFNEAMLSLPEQMRKCLYLKIAHDYSHEQIAQALGIAVNTVKAHLFQARNALRKQLGETHAVIKAESKKNK